MENTLFNRYAIALLELSIEKNIENEVREEVKSIKILFKTNKDLTYLFDSISLSKDEKYALIDSLFSSYSKEIKDYMKVIIKNNRYHYFYDIFKETLFRFDDYLHIESGKLYVAKKLNETQIKKIKDAISKKLNKKIELDVIEDKSLIGGFKCVLENDIYDASLLKKIESMRKEMIGGK